MYSEGNRGVMGHPSLLTPDEATLSVCREWEDLSTELMQAYQDQALAEVGSFDDISHFSDLLARSTKNPS